MKKTRFDIAFDICNYIFMIIILLIMLYPLYFTIIASVSEPVDVVMGKVTLLPSGFTLDAYRNVFKNDDIWQGYRNTIFYTIFGTIFSLILTIPAAYTLSKKKLHGRLFFSWYFIITMFFTGGLIPTYITVRNLDLLNKFYTLIILFGFSEFYLIVTRIFYQTTIPDELYEASHIDGCTDFGQFFRIALPLSAPIIAVMALFYGVYKWNDYMTSLIFVTDRDLYPLQLILRSILIENQTALAAVQVRNVSGKEMLSMTRKAYMAEAMKYALIFIASAPLLAAYPFVQKYFVKGVLIGSLKG